MVQSRRFAHTTMKESNSNSWIRGVNIGGWLVLENYITPYFFALTECHLQGDFRFYENQIDAPPSSSPIHKLINDNNTAECPPLSKYPVDEWTLTAAFQDKEIAKRYLDIHYEYFVTRQDIADLKANGVTRIEYFS